MILSLRLCGEPPFSGLGVFCDFDGNMRLWLGICIILIDLHFWSDLHL